MRPISYSRSAMVLHWAIALLLAFQLGMGWYMMEMPQGAAMFSAFQLHKSVGITVLLLSFARLALRFLKPRPTESVLGPATRWLSRGVHGLLYFVMIAGPLTGWAVVSTARVAVPTKIFGLIPWPHLPLGQSLHGIAEFLHAQIAWLGVGLFVLHLAGALRHHVGRERQNVLGRMIPGLGEAPSVGRAAVAAGAALALVFAAYISPRAGFWGTTATNPPAVSGVATSSLLNSDADPDVSVKAEKSEPSIAEEPAAKLDASKQPEAADTAPSKWRVSPGGSLGFVAKMNGDTINGRFDRWSADILFDPEALDDSKISVRIGLLSANTGDASRDEMLKGADFFGSAAGEAVYTSSSIRRAGKDSYVANGYLSMNGKSRSVPLSFTLRIVGDSATANGSAQLDRTAFGIGKGQWAETDQIAANVAVNFKLQATRR